MIVTIDFETRSRIGIAGGAWKYAAHPSTEIICMAIKVNDEPAKIYWPEKWELLLGIETEISGSKAMEIILSADTVEAHNAEFEQAIWHYRVKRGKPNWRCTMAKAAMHGLPLSLEKLCEALGSPVKKDMKGNLLMKKVCQPQKDGTFIEDRDMFLRIGEYCRIDANAQYVASRQLDDLSDHEQKIYELTIKKNFRGLPIDVELVDNAIQLNNSYTEELKKEFANLTQVPGPSCLQQFLKWLQENGCGLTDLRAETIRKAVGKYNPQVNRALEIRQELSKSSVKKYETLRNIVEKDGRARGLFVYHGAATGRWAGKGFQPQNLPSRGLIDGIDLAVAMLKDPRYTLEDFKILWGSFSQVLSSAIRPAICAPEGKTFYCADFSAIEARVLAWLAGEEWVLEAYRNGEDLYVKAASKIYNKPEGRITKSERQIGKVAVLACGYQGGKQAFANMAAAYGISIDDDAAQGIVNGWRSSNSRIVSWWKELQDAAVCAIRNSGTAFVARCVVYKCDGKFLTCVLPSGRKLYYPFPRLGMKESPWGETIPTILYKTVTAGKWGETNTYGGSLAENITQAVARDLVAEAMLRLESAGYEVLASIHDEVLAEVADSRNTLKEFESLMVELPVWATGLPIAAEGWEGKRYKK